MLNVNFFRHEIFVSLKLYVMYGMKKKYISQLQNIILQFVLDAMRSTLVKYVNETVQSIVKLKDVT